MSDDNGNSSFGSCFHYRTIRPKNDICYLEILIAADIVRRLVDYMDPTGSCKEECFG